MNNCMKRLRKDVLFFDFARSLALSRWTVGTMKIPRALTLLAVFSVVAALPGAAAARPCKTDPRVVGDCFRVHGRLAYYNGNPSFRIWRIGTDRILGVQDDEAPIVPDNVGTHLSTRTVIF